MNIATNLPVVLLHPRGFLNGIEPPSALVGSNHRKDPVTVTDQRAVWPKGQHAAPPMQPPRCKARDYTLGYVVTICQEPTVRGFGGCEQLPLN
jgi:hypothetical protein